MRTFLFINRPVLYMALLGIFCVVFGKVWGWNSGRVNASPASTTLSSEQHDTRPPEQPKEVSLPKAQKESAHFILPAQDGYGTIECLSYPSECGRLVANAFCVEKGYAEALEFGLLKSEDVTGSIEAHSLAVRQEVHSKQDAQEERAPLSRTSSFPSVMIRCGA